MNKYFLFSMLFFAGCSYPEITPFGEEKGGGM